MTKKLINLIAMLILCLPIACVDIYAQQHKFTAGFAWDANSEVDLAGYRLYHKASQSSQYDYVGGLVDTVSVGTETTTLSYTFEGPVLPITYYWVLTAYNTGGLESGPSNEVSKQFAVPELDPPVSPKNLRIVSV